MQHTKPTAAVRAINSPKLVFREINRSPRLKSTILADDWNRESTPYWPDAVDVFEKEETLEHWRDADKVSRWTAWTFPRRTR